jgi:hypothetical protein
MAVDSKEKANNQDFLLSTINCHLSTGMGF